MPETRRTHGFDKIWAHDIFDAKDLQLRIFNLYLYKWFVGSLASMGKWIVYEHEPGPISLLCRNMAVNGI